MKSRLNSTNSYGFFSIMSEKSLPKISKNKKYKIIIKFITIFITLGLIIYIFIDYDRVNEIIKDDLYHKMLENYDKINIYADIIDYLTNYHMFFIFFIFGFCLWNLYKSFIHILGFFIIQFIIFILKLIFRKKAKILTINFDKKILSDNAINDICELTSEYECPSYRAAYVVYSYMSFITLLFREKKLRNKNITKIFFKIFFVIICIILNISLIFLIQSTIGSIFIGGAIGFIIYFIMFSLLKIDYDRSEQMIYFLDINIFFYILINAIILGIVLCLYFLLPIDPDEKNEFNYLCGNTKYECKEMNLETIFKCSNFFCNLIMIICIKLQRKYLFVDEGEFMSRNFSVEEIVEQNNLMAHIKGEETLKLNTKHILRYLCKVFISLGFAVFAYLIYKIIEYYKSENYIALSIICYLLPINLVVIYLFFLSKKLFLYLDLEMNNYSD